MLPLENITFGLYIKIEMVDKKQNIQGELVTFPKKG